MPTLYRTPIGFDPVTGRAIFQSERGGASVVKVIRQTYTPIVAKRKDGKALPARGVNLARVAQDVKSLERAISVLQRQRETLLKISKLPPSSAKS